MQSPACPASRLRLSRWINTVSMQPCLVAAGTCLCPDHLAEHKPLSSLRQVLRLAELMVAYHMLSNNDTMVLPSSARVHQLSRTG